MPQMITTPNGEKLVLLSRAEYDRLVTLAAEAEEDAADIAAYDAAMEELAAGRDNALPERVSALVLKGESLVSAIRKWRGLRQTQLAERAGLSQGFLSDLESGRRRGAADTMAALARALDVPVSWLA